MTIKKSRKRVVSILLILTLLLSLMPAAAFAADYQKVEINGGKIKLSDGNYLANNSATDAKYSANEPAQYVAWYKNGVLTLNNYKGSYIEVGGIPKSDLIVKLKGNNIINSSYAAGITQNGGGGSITVTSDSSHGKLTINVSSDKQGAVAGINNTFVSGAIKGDVTIKGYADVTIDAANTKDLGKSYGIFGKTVSVLDNANVTIKSQTPKRPADAQCYGIFAEKDVTINTNGTIKIDVTKAGTGGAHSYGISPNNYTLKLLKVEEMEITWKKGINTSEAGAPYLPISASFDTNAYAINVDTTNCYASYRKGAPHQVTAGNGTLTGLGVPNASGRGMFLENDTVSLTPNTKTGKSGEEIPFTKWTSEDINLTNLTAKNISVTVPDRDIMIIANHTPFIGAPSFTLTSGTTGTVTFQTKVKPSGANEGFKYVKVGDENAESKYIKFYGELTPSASDPYDYSFEVRSTFGGGDRLEEGSYRIAEYLDNWWYLSEPFTVSYDTSQLPKLIDTVSLTVDEPVGGAKVQDTVSAIADANPNYTITGSDWWDTNYNSVTGTFAAGKQYTWVASLTANDGYLFTKTTTGTVNDKAAQIANMSSETSKTLVITQTFTAAADPKVLTGIKITTPPDKVVYTEGERFDPKGMVVRATYDDNSSSVVHAYTYSPDGALSTSDTKITVSYTKDGVIKTATQDITVKAAAVPKTLTGIEITTPPAKVEYTEGESFDAKGMVVTAKYDDNSSNVVTSYEYTPKGALSTSNNEISVSYTEGSVTQTATQTITVKAAPLDTVAAPSFAPSEKTFAYTVDVTLTTATEDADIYYTLDSSDPTVTSTKYTSAITLTDTTTIKAIAVKTGMTDSTISTATYTKQAPSAVIDDVTISGKLGTTLSAKDVTITLTNDTFKDLNVGQSVVSWFNLPQALIAKIKSINTDKNSIVITIDGTPTEACAEQIAVSIPAMWLKSGKDLTVTPNSNAKYNIAAADTYQLNITLGKNMTASGTLSQNITATHAMTAVTVTADSGYYFPKNYANLGMLSGVTVARDNATTLTISGTPSMSMNINLADAAALSSVALPTAATGLVYNGDEQDSGIAENAGYTLTGELKGTAAKDYLATATLNDGYVWSDGITDKAREIKWSIAKADITATAPTATNTKLIYNGKAQDLIIAGTTDFGDWQYKVNDGAYGTTIPQGTNAATYRVYFKIDGDDNHNAVSEKYFDVTIDKADPDYEIPTDLKGYQGRALSTVNLPGGWSWKDGSERMSKTGNQTFKATFTPNDTDNYNIIENIDVTVNVRSTALPGGAAQTEFGITAPKADNGSIGISQKEASAGTTIIVSLTPAEGYKAGSLTVTDKNGNKLTLKSAGENKYTFTMPAADVNVKATFAKADGSSTVDPKTAIIMQIGNLHMTVNGKDFTNDVAPVIMNDRTLVPIRVVTETFGGSADWNALTKEVTLNLDGKTIKMTVGQTINKYGVAPMIIDGRTYVPIRFVADELGAVTTWINATRTVVIEK